MLLQKDLGSFCFSSTSQFSVNKCKKSAVSKKIVSVMAPQQSERRPATTGSVKFPSFDLNLIILIIMWFQGVGLMSLLFLLVFLGKKCDDVDGEDIFQGFRETPVEPGRQCVG